MIRIDEQTDMGMDEIHQLSSHKMKEEGSKERCLDVASPGPAKNGHLFSDVTQERG